MYNAKKLNEYFLINNIPSKVSKLNEKNEIVEIELLNTGRLINYENQFALNRLDLSDEIYNALHFSKSTVFDKDFNKLSLNVNCYQKFGITVFNFVNYLDSKEKIYIHKNVIIDFNNYSRFSELLKEYTLNCKLDEFLNYKNISFSSIYELISKLMLIENIDNRSYFENLLIEHYSEKIKS